MTEVNWGDVAVLLAEMVDLTNSETSEVTAFWNNIILLSAGILEKEGV
jgi:hypothetical protein